MECIVLFISLRVEGKGKELLFVNIADMSKYVVPKFCIPNEVVRSLLVVR